MGFFVSGLVADALAGYIAVCVFEPGAAFWDTDMAYLLIRSLGVLRAHTLCTAIAVALTLPVLAQSTEQLPNLDEMSASDATQEDVSAAEIFKAMGINFIPGPTTGDMGNSQIVLDGSWAFLNGPDSVKLMSLYGNQQTGMEKGLITKQGELDGWFAIFEFDDIGYIENADEEELDAKAILKSFKDSDEVQNQWRESNGMDPLHTVGWKTKPHYDPITNNLEWCLELESGGQPVLNHNIRLLGRKGVMSVTLVCDPAELDSALSDVHAALDGYTYKSGESYAEYRSGDKIARYGLATLVTGGAIAVAAKSGLLGKLIKPLLIGGAVVIGAFAKFFKRLFGGASA